jgi:hypothetical protein
MTEICWCKEYPSQDDAYAARAIYERSAKIRSGVRETSEGKWELAICYEHPNERLAEGLELDGFKPCPRPFPE